MSSKRKPAAAIVSIGITGIRDVMRKCFYYSDWMREHIGRKVFVLSDLFSGNRVLIYDSVDGDFLGEADVLNRQPSKAKVRVCRSILA